MQYPIVLKNTRNTAVTGEVVFAGRSQPRNSRSVPRLLVPLSLLLLSSEFVTHAAFLLRVYCFLVKLVLRNLKALIHL